MRQPAIATNRPFTAVCNTGELFRTWGNLPIASSITGSSAMTRRRNSCRIGCVSGSSGPASAKVPTNRRMTSIDISAIRAASRRLALPKSVPASTTPAETMPTQISVQRITASTKASPFAPPTAPSSLLAMIAAVIPASCATTAKELRSIVATKAQPAPHNARPTRKATRFCGKHAVSTTIATAPTTVPIMRNQPLRSEAPRCG